MLDDSLTISYPSESRAVLAFKGAWTLHETAYDWRGLKQELRSHAGLEAISLDTGQLVRWDSQFLNLLQHLYVARALVPLLKRSAAGDLVIIGSESALSGGRKGAVYSACKFALRGFAQSLRAECSNSGVRVCLINPGMVDTGFYDDLNFKPGELAENALRAEDIANTVMLVVHAHPGTVFDEINLNPLKKVIQFKD
ncbi:MAG: hypothetical protein B6D77_01265 [gamma proteobacterium symbiont of Ctena orbiculata]|nr:MAG: hypothetical protein B6D77_01265 [gamma proteobacterium symbiont of Ctena orbiculata]